MSDQLLDELPKRTASASWTINRRRNRWLGLDRYGRPLPRVAGTNPRALGTNPRARRGVDDVVRDDRTLAETQLARRLGWVA